MPTEEKPRKYGRKILLIIIIIILVLIAIYITNPDVLPDGIRTPADKLSTNIDVFIANQESDVSIIKIGENDNGYVTLEGPYGDESSQVSIAYIIGQHPRESQAHDALEKEIKENSKNLHYKYYIYKIHVTKNTTDYSESRMNGQILARDFVVPDINSKDYRLVVDIHSSNAFYYPEPYIFTPGSNAGASINYAQKIARANSEWLSYYEPPEYTSPKYSTQLIKDNGTPALVFEAYGEPGISVEEELSKLVATIDALR